MIRLLQRGFSSNQLIVATALFIVAVHNQTFFSKLVQDYGWSLAIAPSLLALGAVLLSLYVLLLSLLCLGRAAKPLLVVMLLTSAIGAYFMDSFGIVIDTEMWRSVMQTQTAEAEDLLSWRLLGWVLLAGVVPAICIVLLPIEQRGCHTAAWARVKLVVASLALMLALIVVFGAFFASFAREHKPVRGYANPAYPLYSSASPRYATATI